MRQIVSTAVVAVIVGALAGATMSAVAQAPAEQAITPAAGINAATVDGKSAVGYTNKKGKRRGKLVATNKVGELPSNIVRPFWGLLRDVPAGFADGVDNEGVTGITITRVAGPSQTVPVGSSATDTVNCAAGSVAIGGGMNGTLVVVEDSYPSGNGWFVRGTDEDGVGGGSFSGWVVCMTVDPATAITTANRGKIGPASREK